MMKMSFTAIAAALSLAMGVGSAQAQSAKICNDGLVANYEYEEFDSNHKLLWISLITKDNFHEMRRKAGGSIKLDGVDLGATYEEFEVNRKKYLDHRLLSQSEELRTSRFRAIVSPQAREKWLACVREMSRNEIGLHVWVERENALGADVHVVWRALPEDHRQATIQSQTLRGGTVAGLPEGQWLPEKLRLQSGGNYTALIERADGASEIRGAVTMNGITRNFYIPEILPPKIFASINIEVTGEQTVTYSETFSDTLLHACNPVEIWRPRVFCSADGKQPISVESFATVELPPRYLNSGGLAPNGCFQVLEASVKGPAWEGASNCTIVDVRFRECPSFQGASAGEIRSTRAACVRGLTEGTPFRVTLAGVFKKSRRLRPFTNQTAFDGSKRWEFPAERIPATVSNLKFDYVVNIVDVTTGRIVILNSANRQRGGYRFDVADGGRTVILLRDRGKRFEEQIGHAGWIPPVDGDVPGLPR